MQVRNLDINYEAWTLIELRKGLLARSLRKVRGKPGQWVLSLGVGGASRNQRILTILTMGTEDKNVRPVHWTL